MSRKTKFAEYEMRKKAWVLTNPTATHKEFEQALSSIAKELGL